MASRSGLYAGGNWIVDKLKAIDTFPQQDALANILSESIGNGGSPFNILVDLARLKAAFPLAGIGMIGGDSDGAWILEQCAAGRIDANRLRKHDFAPTSYTDVMTVRGTGRRTFFHQRGANAFLGAEHFDFSNCTAKIFHLGYLLLLDRLDGPDEEFGILAARVLQQARDAGCKTSVDVVSEDSDRFGRIVLPVLRYVDYCMLNEFEAERTTGIPIRIKDRIDLKGLKLASQALLNAGVHEWVVIHFPEGASALGRDGELHLQGSLRIPQEEIVGSVGAGDAFAAGVLYGLHEELPIASALKYGVCAAAACLQGAGTSDGMKPLADCLAMGEEKGFRPVPEP